MASDFHLKPDQNLAINITTQFLLYLGDCIGHQAVREMHDEAAYENVGNTDRTR